MAGEAERGPLGFAETKRNPNPNNRELHGVPGERRQKIEGKDLGSGDGIAVEEAERKRRNDSGEVGT